MVYVKESEDWRGTVICALRRTGADRPGGRSGVRSARMRNANRGRDHVSNKHFGILWKFDWMLMKERRAAGG